MDGRPQRAFGGLFATHLDEAAEPIEVALRALLRRPRASQVAALGGAGLGACWGRELAEKGYHLFRLRRSYGLSALASPAGIGREKIKTADFLLFNQELAALLRAGLPLLQGLDIMLERMKNPFFQSVLKDIREILSNRTYVRNIVDDLEERCEVLGCLARLVQRDDDTQAIFLFAAEDSLKMI